jgi:hypothetical protein
MWRRCATASFAAMMGLAAACGIEVDGPRDSARTNCATDGDLDCEPIAVTGADDACWRMVQCRAVRVTNPESDPSCCFDWAACVHHVEALPDDEFEQALACIESASCDELKPAQRGQLPRCLEQLRDDGQGG